MTIDYYTFYSGEIKKHSIFTEDEEYISHDDNFVKLLTWNPFNYRNEERDYNRNFEDIKKLAIKSHRARIEKLTKEFEIILHSTKASNE